MRSNAQGGKFLCLEPQSEASLEIPWELRAFFEGQRPSVSFATYERASERVFDAKLTAAALCEAIARRRLDAKSQADGPRTLLERRRHVKLAYCNARSLWLMSGMCGLSLEVTDLRVEPPSRKCPL